MCFYLTIISTLFLVNLIGLLLSFILLRSTFTKFILIIFTLLLLYIIYILHFIKIYNAFEFFMLSWVSTITYVFILITFISFIFTVIFFNYYIYHYIVFIITIYISTYILLFTNNLIVFFISYELLLFPAFYILYIFAKTYRCVEAAYVMLFWTQFGAIILITVIAFIYLKYNIYYFNNLFNMHLTLFEKNLLFILIFISFGVKMPIWPFHVWLPKAHVEAPTNFSIFLSGVLVKIAFFAFIKFIFYSFIIISYWFIFIWLILGIFDVSMRLFYQIDLKKIIAYTTVIEMHWLLLMLLQSTTLSCISAILMLFSHAILSSLFFLLTDSISRRFNTRYITELNSLWLFAPNLTTIILITNILFLGFPCTSLFWSEFFLFMYLLELNPILYGILIIMLFFLIPIILFRIWIQIMYGNLAFKFLYIKNNYYNQKCYDINKLELMLYIFLLLHIVIIGIYPSILLL